MIQPKKTGSWIARVADTLAFEDLAHGDSGVAAVFDTQQRRQLRRIWLSWFFAAIFVFRCLWWSWWLIFVVVVDDVGGDGIGKSGQYLAVDKEGKEMCACEKESKPKANKLVSVTGSTLTVRRYEQNLKFLYWLLLLPPSPPNAAPDRKRIYHQNKHRQTGRQPNEGEWMNEGDVLIIDEWCWLLPDFSCRLLLLSTIISFPALRHFALLDCNKYSFIFIIYRLDRRLLPCLCTGT